MSFVNSGSQSRREKGDLFLNLRQKAGLASIEPIAQPQAACCPHADRDLRTKWVYIGKLASETLHSQNPDALQQQQPASVQGAVHRVLVPLQAEQGRDDGTHLRERWN